MENNLTEQINHFEEYISSYKEILKNLYLNKEIDKKSELFIWFKNHLRKELNECENHLKYLIKRKTYDNQGLSLPVFIK